MPLDGLDGSARAHNPKVAGSNPAPATTASRHSLGSAQRQNPVVPSSITGFCAFWVRSWECTEPADNETATLSGGDWWITQAYRR
jgi:hypothetical protein